MQRSATSPDNTNAVGPYAVNTTQGCGSASTGGTWTIDYSQNASGPIAFTDIHLSSTTQFDSSAKPVGKNYVGNIISITGGTGFNVCRAEIASTSGTTATCSNFSTGSTLGTNGSTGGTGGLGGPLASPGYAGLLKVAGNQIFVQSGTYMMTSGTSNISYGRVTDSTGNPPRGTAHAMGRVWYVSPRQGHKACPRCRQPDQRDNL